MRILWKIIKSILFTVFFIISVWTFVSVVIPMINNGMNIDNNATYELQKMYDTCNKIINNVLDKKLDNTSGIENGENSYLIYEGKIDKLSELTVKVGMWVSYEDITNEYMNSGFVGTMKVYIESK